MFGKTFLLNGLPTRCAFECIGIQRARAAVSWSFLRPSACLPECSERISHYTAVAQMTSDSGRYLIIFFFLRAVLRVLENAPLSMDEIAGGIL